MSDDTAADVKPTEGVEIDTTAEVEPAADDASPDTVARRTARIPVIAAGLVLALLVAAGVDGWLFFTQYRPDQQTDDAVAQSVVNAARDGTVAVLSYKPDTFKQDFASAKSHLSGDFLDHYDQFAKDVLTPAASRGVTTAAQVVGAAASELHPDTAVVLVFVNQITTSKEHPDPSMASSSVKVSLTKLHGQWLITKFEPV